MSRKTRSILKALSVLLVLLGVLIQMDYVSIVFLDPHRFWLVVLGYAILLTTSR